MILNDRNSESRPFASHLLVTSPNPHLAFTSTLVFPHLSMDPFPQAFLVGPVTRKLGESGATYACCLGLAGETHNVLALLSKTLMSMLHC